MNEQKTRYLCLILAAAEAMLVSAYFGIFIVGMSLPMMMAQGGAPPPELLFFLGGVMAAGLLILLGAFFRTAYHLLAACELALAVWVVWLNAFHLTMLLIGIVFILPHILYYALRLTRRFSDKSQRKTQLG